MTDTYLIGIDCGTESARAAIFTADGKMVASEAASYKLRHPNPGWAEQRPDEWWSAIVAAIRGTVEASGVDPEAIVGIKREHHGAWLDPCGRQ